MNPLYLVLIGKRASGKDELSDYALAEYGMVKIVFSEEIANLGIEYGQMSETEAKDKAILQRVGEFLRKTYGAQIYTGRIADKARNNNSTINGLRGTQEISLLEQYLGEIVLVGVEADKDLRYERALNRGSVKTREEFDALEAHVSESQIERLLDKCEYRFTNNGSLHEFHAGVDEFLYKHGIPKLAKT